MVQTEDYYQLLGVSRYASQDILKRAFRACVLGVHPDRNKTDERAAESTRRIIEAYRTLGNPAARRQYDLSLQAACRLPTAPPEHPASAWFVWFICAAKRVAALALLACALIIAGGMLAADRSPVFRAALLDQGYQAPMKQYPLTLEPRPTDCLEWYRAREYQMHPATSFYVNSIGQLRGSADRTRS